MNGIPLNQVQMPEIEKQKTKDSIVADYLGRVGQIGQGIVSGAGQAIGRFGTGIKEAGADVTSFIEEQQKTPEGQLLLTNILAGITQALGASPQVSKGLVQAGQRQYQIGVQEQQRGISLQQKAVAEQEKRQQKLLDEQRKRQEKIEDTLYLARMKKEQDPQEARFNARTEASHKLLSKFETEKNPYYKDTKQFVLDTKVPYLFKSDKFKQIEQAQRDFINAVLRRESGAVIGEQEFENARLQYFPQPGDTPKVVEQKQKNREMQFEKIEELQKDAQTLTSGYEIVNVRNQ